MDIFIQHQGEQDGPLSLQQLQAGLANGTYQPSDLIWHQGGEAWIPVSMALEILRGTAPSPSVAPAVKSDLAITSMILGIAGFLCGVTAIPAAICGHIALAKIKRSQGRLTGGAYAVAGIYTGYIGIFVFILITGLKTPMIIRQKKKADEATAISNMSSLHYAFMGFEEEYGGYPNAETAARVANDFFVPAVTGNSSNARFRQLFQAGMIETEEIFYAKSAGIRKPDGVFTGDKTLEPGECGFGYIENVGGHSGKPRPLVITPFKPGSGEFDAIPFDGKAVALYTDGSVRVLPIDRGTGKVMLDGQNLFDPDHPIWGGTTPTLLLPE